MYLMELVNSSMGNEASEYSCDIGMWSYYKILRVLFPDTTVHFDYFCVSDFGVAAKPTDANVINGFDAYVKEQLDLGNPVMLHIADYNEETGVREGYHSVVAYYYDEYGIHAHFGWNRSSSDTVITSNYQITEAGVMDLTNIPETHSNNYVVNNVEYCGCGLQTHIHNYEDHYCTMCNQYTETHDYHDPYIWVDFSKHDAPVDVEQLPNKDTPYPAVEEVYSASEQDIKPVYYVVEVRKSDLFNSMQHQPKSNM